VNGTKVGQTGAFPPSYRGDRSAYRRYAVPASMLHWGGENVLAVRVYDGGGDGGLWTGRRDRAADTWVIEGREQWWTVALINWDDERRHVRLPLASAGIPGPKCHAYDVWNAKPLPDVTGAVETDLEPHEVLVLSLRPTTTKPKVLGTTRHVVQGAVDITEEEWDAATRTLKVRAQRLDGRPYGVTVSVPRGQVPATCTSTVPCTMRRLTTGEAVLEWPATERVRDLEWTLKFRAAAPRRAS